jgi:hypothetical protein
MESIRCENCGKKALFNLKCNAYVCGSCKWKAVTVRMPRSEYEKGIFGLPPKRDAPKDAGVTHPSHYAERGIEPVDFAIKNKLGFCEGNIVKYVTRYQFKNGKDDLLKARYYIDLLIKELEEEATNV